MVQIPKQKKSGYLKIPEDVLNHKEIQIILRLFLVIPMYCQGSTVGIKPMLSDPFTTRTSKLGWRYFEANKIDRNKLQIRSNKKKGTGTKMTEKLNNFEKFERK